MATKSKQKPVEKKIEDSVIENKDVEKEAIKEKPKKKTEKVETVSIPVDDYTRLLEQLTKFIEKQANSGANENAKISRDELIEVISLSPAITNVSTGGRGFNSRNYRFAGFGVSIEIPYDDLVSIVQNNQGAFDRGFLYINDARFVKSQGLSLAMKKILTKEQMENIIYGDDINSVNLLEKASKDQKKHIADILVNLINKGESVDMNKLKRISDYVGYKVEDRAAYIKEALQSTKQ